MLYMMVVVYYSCGTGGGNYVVVALFVPLRKYCWS